MKVSEAKRLQPGDTVFFFIHPERIKGTVVKVVVESLQKIWIDLEWHDASGSVFSVRRIHTAAYLTKETLARIVDRTQGNRPQACVVEINPAMIPSDVVAAAVKITEWMQHRGHKRWKLMGIQSRED